MEFRKSMIELELDCRSKNVYNVTLFVSPDELQYKMLDKCKWTRLGEDLFI